MPAGEYRKEVQNVQGFSSLMDMRRTVFHKNKMRKSELHLSEYLYFLHFTGYLYNYSKF